MRALGRLPRHAEPLLAGERAGRHLRRDRAAVRGDRRRDLRPDRRAAAPTDDFRPRALFERFGIEVLATTDDPCRRPGRARGARATTRLVAAGCIPTFRPDRYLEPGRAGWRRRWSTALGEAADVDTGDYAGLHRGAGGPAPATSSRTAPSRPTTATPTSAPTRSDQREAERIYAAALARRRRRRTRPPRCAATCCSRWRGCPCEDGLVMTLHPGVHRNHHAPDARPVRRRHRARHPGRRSSSPTRCSPLLERFGTAPGLPPRAVHPRRDGLLPRARAAGRASTRASTRARRGGSSTRPRRSAASAARSPRPPASAAPRASSTTPARSARSRPATTCPAGSTPATSPSWSPSTASTRTRRSRRRVDLVAVNPKVAFKL